MGRRSPKAGLALAVRDWARGMPAGLASARAHEQERRRAESLAELDRSKTAFFSNISHEFRTPLTSMIGPTEDALARSDPGLKREELETLHRNELRLLKLVNSLLDFSRIEAGCMKVSLEPVDLALLTADLATGFRAAIASSSVTSAENESPPSEPVAVPVTVVAAARSGDSARTRRARIDVIPRS